ncbi:MAG: hypothetical protein ABIK92_03100 [Pseudomonadota bacterium]
MNSNDKNIWDYITIGWIFACLTVAIILLSIYRFEFMATASFVLFPFILCGVLIPLFIFYDKSNLSFPKIVDWISKVRPGKSKNIHYLCILTVPLTILFILFLIIFPEAFLEYGPEFGKNYAYKLAFIQFLYLIAYVGFWKEQKWGIYFYIFSSVFGILVLNYGLKIPIRATGFLWDLFVIFYGFVYLPKTMKKRS